MATNPYLQLSRKVRGLLMAEAKLSKEERENNQWQLLIKFAGTQVVIGKGHVNTIFFQFGEKGKRDVCYPDQILDRLDKLSKQRFWRYVIRDKAGAVVKYYWSERLALKTEPEIRHTLNGINDEGETPIMIGGANAEGKFWKKHK